MNSRARMLFEEGQPVIKVVQLEVIHFFDKHAPRADGKVGSEIILIYTLGEDGVVREFANGVWTAFPITSQEKVL